MQSLAKHLITFRNKFNKYTYTGAQKLAFINHDRILFKSKPHFGPENTIKDFILYTRHCYGCHKLALPKSAIH